MTGGLHPLPVEHVVGVHLLGGRLGGIFLCLRHHAGSLGFIDDGSRYLGVFGVGHKALLCSLSVAVAVPVTMMIAAVPVMAITAVVITPTARVLIPASGHADCSYCENGADRHEFGTHLSFLSKHLGDVAGLRPRTGLLAADPHAMVMTPLGTAALMVAVAAIAVPTIVTAVLAASIVTMLIATVIAIVALRICARAGAQRGGHQPSCGDDLGDLHVSSLRARRLGMETLYALAQASFLNGSVGQRAGGAGWDRVPAIRQRISRQVSA